MKTVDERRKLEMENEKIKRNLLFSLSFVFFARHTVFSKFVSIHPWMKETLNEEPYVILRLSFNFALISFFAIPLPNNQRMGNIYNFMSFTEVHEKNYKLYCSGNDVLLWLSVSLLLVFLFSFFYFVTEVKCEFSKQTICKSASFPLT